MTSPTPTPERLEEFLRESNAIEGVYDEDSLKQARYAWDFIIKQKNLTTGRVLKTHKILMSNQPLAPDQIGYFRKVPVWVGGKEAIHPLRVADEVKEWVSSMNMDTLIDEDGVLFKLRHIEYERIHPFVDGNGRTGRMFMNWQRLRAGLPLHIIHEGKEQLNYYAWFK